MDVDNLGEISQKNGVPWGEHFQVSGICPFPISLTLWDTPVLCTPPLPPLLRKILVRQFGIDSSKSLFFSARKTRDDLKEFV